MELGYARASTTGPDLARQLDALTAAGLDPTRIHLDGTSGAARPPGWWALLDSARGGYVIVAHTLDRLGTSVRETVTLIEDLHRRGVGVRTLADPLRIDSSDPDNPTAQLAVAMLALFGRMDRTYARERAAPARAVATTTDRRPGRPSVVTASQLAHVVRLRDGGATVAEIVAATGLTRSTLYRHLPPRPPVPARPVPAADPDRGAPGRCEPGAVAATAAKRTPSGDRLVCPSCGYRPTHRDEAMPHLADLAMTWLHLDAHRRISERRHCARCQPHGPVLDVACNRCHDGPLVTGSGVPNTETVPAAVAAWLAHHGWTLTPDLVCSTDVRAVAALREHLAEPRTARPG